MSDVFISYARKTAKHAKAAAVALEARGYSVWFDEQLPAHLAFSDVIEQELAQAKAVLVIWSNDAIGSEWVRAEASRGRRQKKLVQLKVEKAQLPMPFDQLHCADLSGWDGQGEPANWSSVISSIEKLVKADAPPAPAPARAAPEAGQRRHLTVLSCGLVNAAALARSLDLEDWHALAQGYRKVVTEVLSNLGGFVVQPGEDDLIACFGYPTAQEDAAERAVRAGLLIIESMAALSAEFKPDAAGLAVQVGVDAGIVVVAPDEHGKVAIFGETAKTVALVRAAGPLNRVVVSRAVAQLISGRFVTEPQGELPLPGMDKPMDLQVVLAAKPLIKGEGSASGRAATPFVGRDDERQLLLSRWKRTRDGDGQLVLLTGEPGIGKTRLVQRFRDSIEGEDHLWIDCAGASLFAGTTFHVVTQLLEQGLGFEADDGPAQRFDRLEAALRDAGANTAESAPLIAEILNLPTPASFQNLDLSPDQRRQRQLAALQALVFSFARRRPLVVAMDDLQWVDPSTLELVRSLAEQGARANLLLLFTARPEFRAAWPARAHHAQVTLSRLNSREARELVAGVGARVGLAPDIVDAVIARADGVPLFAEELILLMADGQGRLGANDIPETLLDSLAARLDRLGPAREVAQVASVLGREFSYDLLSAVANVEGAELQSALQTLADAELIHVEGHPPDATFQFKHALILDAANAALLKNRRRELHGRVARALTDLFPDRAQLHPEVVARHWSEAGEVSSAIAAWIQAGQQAASRAAHVEAEARLQRALDLLRTLPPGPERTQTELPLLIILAISTCAVHGFTAPRLAKALLEARAICDTLGNTAALFDILIAICNFQITAGDLDAAEQTCRLCDKISRETGDPAQLILTGTADGYILHTRGDLAGARRRLEEVVDLYTAHGGEKLVYGVPQDPLVTSLVVLAVVLAVLGEFVEAGRAAERCLSHARALGRPFDIAWALQWRASMFIAFGDFATALDCAEEGHQVSEANAYSHFASTSLVLKGLALGGLGRMEEGMNLFRPAFADRKRAGAVGPLGMFLGEAAILLLRSGDAGAALTAIDEAIDLASHGGRISLPTLCIYRAEILAAQPDADPARVLDQLRQAISIADAQGGAPNAARGRALLAAYQATSRWPTSPAPQPAVAV